MTAPPLNLRHLAVAARQLAGPVERRNLSEADEVAIAELIAILENDDAQIVRPDDIIGAKGAAELLDVEKSTLTRWKREGYLPAPFQDLPSGPVWLRPVLLRFREEHSESSDAAGRRPVGSRHAAPQT